MTLCYLFRQIKLTTFINLITTNIRNYCKITSQSLTKKRTQIQYVASTKKQKTIAEHLKLDDIAEHLKLDDIAEHLKLDDIAEHLKLDDIAEHLKLDDTAEHLKLDDRIEQFSQREAFITLKDHKENFQNNTKCRLINPGKSEIGIISKHYTETINNTIREKTQVNQWRNTKLVIKWFKAIKNKSKCSFIKFDIVDFYPSISEELLSKAIAYAQSVTTIEQKVIRTIYHSSKSLLFDRDNVWIKKDNPEFDVTMGSYDGAELCELVGLYLLDLLAKEFDKKYFGLYRDDGLGCFENISGPDSERIKKNIIKIFKSNGLNITAECNLIVTDCLDVI